MPNGVSGTSDMQVMQMHSNPWYESEITPHTTHRWFITANNLDRILIQDDPSTQRFGEQVEIL